MIGVPSTSTPRSRSSILTARSARVVTIELTRVSTTECGTLMPALSSRKRRSSSTFAPPWASMAQPWIGISTWSERPIALASNGLCAPGRSTMK
ncbi:hypothetical protein D3C80_1661900 [compost metagenome]